MAARTPTGLCGLLAIDKPVGPTSHDVVSVIRRLSGERRVGHGGTLDPLASGVLVVAVGPATRLTRFLLGAPKRYLAGITFGSETTTDDSQGEVTVTTAQPASLADLEAARDFLAGAVGVQEQTPPAYSAVKVDGTKAYAAARKGRDLDLQPRTVEVRRADLVSVHAGPPVVWVVDLEVSKGTYIRALARDWGRELDSAAHISSLRRTALGSVSEPSAVPLDRLTPDNLQAHFLNIPAALGLPVRELSDAEAELVADGRSLTPFAGPSGPVALMQGDRLRAVYDAGTESVDPLVVLPGGCG